MINIIGNGSGIKLAISANVAIYLTLFIDAIGSGMIIPLLPFYAATFNAGSTHSFVCTHAVPILTNAR
jgi:hypothetical protein